MGMNPLPDKTHQKNVTINKGHWTGGMCQGSVQKLNSSCVLGEYGFFLVREAGSLPTKTRSDHTSCNLDTETYSFLSGNIHSRFLGCGFKHLSYFYPYVGRFSNLTNVFSDGLKPLSMHVYIFIFIYIYMIWSPPGRFKLLGVGSLCYTTK